MSKRDMSHPHGNRPPPSESFQALEHLIVRRVKLARPLLPPDIVPRQRVLDQLDGALRCSLTLVIGPAGFGKTTALAAWAEHLAAPVAWLSLDEDDNDLLRFAAHVLAAVRGITPGLGPTTGRLLCLPEPPQPSIIGMQLADELLDLPDEIVLILDDVHLISDPAVYALLEALIRFPPPALHLVLGSRLDPPLPIHKLRGRGLLAEIRSRDLRFTRQEAYEFFSQVSGGAFPSETIDLLDERMDGWPAGLRLAWLALRDQATVHELPQAAAALLQLPVREYLMEEVVSHLPAEHVDFLLRTSILARLTAPLCEAVLDQEQPPGWALEILDQLARGNPFLTPLDAEGNWYRYHHLLQQVLRNRLRLVFGEEAVKALHRRASAWFAAQGLIDEAVRHALDADAGDAAARLVEAHVPPALDAQNWVALGSWLRLLPDELVRRRPALLLARAWYAELGGRVSEIESCLADLEPFLDRPQSIADDDNGWLRASARTLRIAMHGTRVFLGDYPLGSGGNEVEAIAALTAELQAEALAITQEVPGSDVAAHQNPSSWMMSTQLIYRAFALQALGQAPAAIAELRDAVRQCEQQTGCADYGLLMAAGIIHLLEGQLSEVDAVARRLLRTATREDLRESIAWAHVLLAITNYERNGLIAAMEHLEQVKNLSDYAHSVAHIEGQFALGLLLQAQGHAQAAQAAIGALISRLEVNGTREQLASAASFRARLALMQGDTIAAQAWLSDPISQPQHRRMIFIESILLTRAWALLASNSEVDRERSIALLKQLRHDTESAHRWWLCVRVLALLALAYDAQGRPESAMSTVQEAIALAAPRGLLRAFVDFGPAMERLLRRFIRVGGASRFVSQILAAFPAPEPRLETPPRLTALDDELIERLSDRELEILRLMYQHLNNEDIGERLSISPLTVKRHSINIYGKLGVSSRRSAILKGSALGLLPRI